uniref:Uncharacterized protein n=1 Tax=Auxenochlorella protothecoides TaxID=3075 RepID=A0A1D2A248_AUXPR
MSPNGAAPNFIQILVRTGEILGDFLEDAAMCRVGFTCREAWAYTDRIYFPYVYAHRWAEAPSAHYPDGIGTRATASIYGDRSRAENEAIRAMTRLQWDKRVSEEDLRILMRIGYPRLQGLLTGWIKMPVTQCGKRFWAVLISDFLKGHFVKPSEAQCLAQGGRLGPSLHSCLMRLVNLLHLMADPSNPVSTPSPPDMWEPVMTKARTALAEQETGMATKAANYAKLECIVRALFPTPGLPDRTEGEQPYFELALVSENSAGYCPTILPDFAIDKCLTPCQAYLVLLLVANSLSVLIEPWRGRGLDFRGNAFAVALENGEGGRPVRMDLCFTKPPEAGRALCVLRSRGQTESRLPYYLGVEEDRFWLERMLHLSVQGYVDAVAKEWVLPRDAWRAQRAQTLLGVLWSQAGARPYPGDTRPNAYHQLQPIWRHWHLARLFDVMTILKRGGISMNSDHRDPESNGLITVPPMAEQLQRHEHGLCRFRPGTVVSAVDHVQAYCIVIYTGCEREEGTWHPEYIPGSISASQTTTARCCA